MVTPLEEQELKILNVLILDKTRESQTRAVGILSRHITNCFNVGVDDALKQTGNEGKVLRIDRGGLETLIAEDVAPALNDAYGFMAQELTDIINSGIANNQTFAQISASLTEKLSTTFGEEIRFDRVGQIKKEVEVLPSGKLRLAERTITRPHTSKVGNYAEVLSRTNVKDAYAKGHVAGYQAAGLEMWRYISAGDERTRPRHLALHGEVYEIGSEQEELALRVMAEALCRCRPVAFFNDPKLDTPKETFTQQKQERAERWMDEKANNTVGREIAKADSFKVKGKALAGMKDTDTKIMSSLAGKPRSTAVSEKIAEFRGSFTSSGQVKHVYQKHVRPGSTKLTFDDVMGSKDRAPFGYSKRYGNSMVLNEANNKAIFKNGAGRIITAHDVNKRSLRRLKDKYQDAIP